MSDHLCEQCEKHYVLAENEYGEYICQDCSDAAAEAAWERRMEDGETFRGGEAAAYNAEQQAWIQRNLK